MDVSSTIEKLKELVKKGNVSRIVVRRNGQAVLNIPVNGGVVGAVVGLSYAKWALLAAAIATVGFGCTVEIVRADGDVVNVMDEQRNQKVRDFAAETVEKVKDTIPVSINVDIKRDADFEEQVDDTTPVKDDKPED